VIASKPTYSVNFNDGGSAYENRREGDRIIQDANQPIRSNQYNVYAYSADTFPLVTPGLTPVLVEPVAAPVVVLPKQAPVVKQEPPIKQPPAFGAGGVPLPKARPVRAKTAQRI